MSALWWQVANNKGWDLEDVESHLIPAVICYVCSQETWIILCVYKLFSQIQTNYSMLAQNLEFISASFIVCIFLKHRLQFKKSHFLFCVLDLFPTSTHLKKRPQKTIESSLCVLFFVSHPLFVLCFMLPF